MLPSQRFIPSPLVAVKQALATVDPMAELTELARRFRAFAQVTGKASPLYAQLSVAIANDPELLDLLHAGPEQQQIPVLLFAAVHDLLLRGKGEELAAFYPNLSSSIPDGDPYPAIRRVAIANGDTLRTTIASRNTQTNEVGRCSYFLPAFGLIADEVGPLAHLDVGASAGLNLCWPLYSYAYNPGGTVGEGSSVQLTCKTRGDPPIPKSMPQLTRGIGLDMCPIDVRDDEAVRWLEACGWPDQAGRFERLVAASNQHDLEGIVACFASDYSLESPVHPARSFHGSQQVRRNWTQLLGAIRDIKVAIVRSAIDGQTVWTEQEMSGTRPDGARHLMRGVFIFGVTGGLICWGRMFLEPVDAANDDADAAVRAVIGTVHT